MENDQELQNDAGHSDYLNAETEFLLQHHQYATQLQRFMNWLIDNLLMRYGLSYLTSTGVALILNEIAPDFLYNLVYEDGRENVFGLFLAGYIIGVFNYLIYYTLCEKLFRGYTLGKLITGTRAIRQDGGELTIRNAFLRSLCRLVPFEPFSGFNTLTWHDSWTGTMVVKSR